MFTGLIQHIGILESGQKTPSGQVLRVRSRSITDDVEIGDSVAVDGVCLTVTSKTSDAFLADVSTESLNRTTLGEMSVGDRVNLEPALRLGDRMGGHMVTGHVDGPGRIAKRSTEGNGTVFTISAAQDLMTMIVEKGSIAVDGISLTVNIVGEEHFSVMVIPHTLEHTTLQDRRPGQKVNLETDILGKYVARLLARSKEDSSGTITADLLARNGYM